MTKLIDTELIAELQARYGEAFAQAVVDHLTRIPGDDRDVECLEVLQMSEVAHRLRAHVRDQIREYRALEARAAVCHNELFYLEREMHLRRKQILQRDANGKLKDGVYALYRSTWSDFLAFFNDYMRKLGQGAPERQVLKARAASRGRFLAERQRQAAARVDNRYWLDKAA